MALHIVRAGVLVVVVVVVVIVVAGAAAAVVSIIIGVVIGVLSVWYALAALHRLQPTGLPVLTPLARLLRRIGIYCEDIGWQAKSKILISFLQVQCVPAPLTQRTYERTTHAHARTLSARR